MALVGLPALEGVSVDSTMRGVLQQPSSWAHAAFIAEINLCMVQDDNLHGERTT